MSSCLVLLLCAALQAQDRPLGKGINFHTLEAERELGAAAAADFRKSVRVIDHPSRSSLQAISDTLAKHIIGNPFAFTVTVFDDAAPFPPSTLASPDARAQQAATEPIAFPGGPVFFPSSLLARSLNDAELAGLLAHAMAHIADRHVTRTMARSTVMEKAVKGLPPDNQPPIPLHTQTLSYTRNFELRADRFAAEWMKAAGYDPRAFAGYLRRLPAPDNARLSLVMPPAEDRAAAIEAMR
jgi:Zn-dependent protease with chaperone function